MREINREEWMKEITALAVSKTRMKPEERDALVQKEMKRVREVGEAAKRNVQLLGKNGVRFTGISYKDGEFVIMVYVDETFRDRVPEIPDEIEGCNVWYQFIGEIILPAID